MSKFIKASALVVALLVGGLAANAIGQIVVTNPPAGTHPVDLTSDVTGTLPETNGGTGQAVYVLGDILLSDGANSLARLPIGTQGQLLQAGASTASWFGLYRQTGTDNLTLGTGSGAVLGTQNTAVGIDALASIAAGGLSNTAVGEDAGDSITTGDNNTFLGSNAGDAVSTGGDNTAVGFDSGASGTFNTSVGSRAGQMLGGSATTNVILGANAGPSLSSGSSNILIGFSAGFAMVSISENVAIGSNALSTATAGPNTAIGFSAGLLISTGTGNTIIGNRAGDVFTTGARNTLIGDNAGGALNVADSDNTALGYNALLVATAGPNTAIGSQAGDAVTTGINNTFVGRDAGGASTTSANNTFLGHQAGLVSDSVGGGNVFVGASAGLDNTSGGSNTFLGKSAGENNTSGGGNVFVGFNAGFTTNSSSETYVGHLAGELTTGANNTFLGNEAGRRVVTGTSNVVIGRMFNAQYAGSRGVIIGSLAGDLLTSGVDNVLIGEQAGNVLGTGAENVYVGAQAGQDSTGDENVFIGQGAGLNATTATGNVFIGQAAVGVIATGNNNVVVGRGAGAAMTSAAESVFLGDGAGDAITTGSFNIFIGLNADGSAVGRASSIGIGHEVVVTADRQAVIGSADADGFLTSMFLGQGVTRVSPTGFTLNATGGSGTNNAAADWIFAGGRGTGTGAGGRLLFQIAPAGSTGSSPNALVDRLILNEDRAEVRGDPGIVVGGFASGNFHVTDPSTLANANAVITGHNSNAGNKQLWYIGSTSSSNDNIAIINRQNGAVAIFTNNTQRINIDNVGAFDFAPSASVTSAELLGWASDETGTGLLVFATSPTFTTSITIEDANTQQTLIRTATIEVTGMSGATVTAAGLIPVGTMVIDVSIRVTTTITGATTFDVGDGTDVDRWGAAIALPAGTTTDIADITIASPVFYPAATDVVLTANGPNFTAGAVRITVHFIDLVAATS